MEGKETVKIEDAIDQANWLMTGEKMLKVMTDLTESYSERELIALEVLLVTRRKELRELAIHQASQ